MLIGIGKRRDEAASEGPVEALLACHRRIRHFTGMAAALAGASRAPEREIAEAAAAVARYFDEALPLHAADEDLSIAPRLLARAPEGPLRAALATMSAEHVEIEATLGEALPLWRAVAAEPAALAGHAGRLAELAARLAAHFEAHLGPEEAVIFPALDALLDPEGRAAIHAEMRARRGASRG
jgi:hypothetical protein